MEASCSGSGRGEVCADSLIERGQSPRISKIGEIFGFERDGNRLGLGPKGLADAHEGSTHGMCLTFPKCSAGTYFGTYFGRAVSYEDGETSDRGAKDALWKARKAADRCLQVPVSVRLTAPPTAPTATAPRDSLDRLEAPKPPTQKREAPMSDQVPDQVEVGLEHLPCGRLRFGHVIPPSHLERTEGRIGTGYANRVPAHHGARHS